MIFTTSSILTIGEPPPFNSAHFVFRKGIHIELAGLQIVGKISPLRMLIIESEEP